MTITTNLSFVGQLQSSFLSWGLATRITGSPSGSPVILVVLVHEAHRCPSGTSRPSQRRHNRHENNGWEVIVTLCATVILFFITADKTDSEKLQSLEHTAGSDFSSDHLRGAISIIITTTNTARETKTIKNESHNNMPKSPHDSALTRLLVSCCS